jgi:hypothetical protein
MKILLIALLLAFSSCTVMYSPVFDSSIAQDVLNARQKTDALYLKMQNANNKLFETYAADYAQVEADINNIVIKQTLRPQGKDFVILISNVQKLFTNYIAEHKAKGFVNNAQISIYNKYMQDAWVIVINSENSLKK